MVHLAAASLGFVCLVAACFVLAGRFARDGKSGWAWFSRVTGVLFAATFLAMASGGGGAAAILAFTAAVVLSWAWLSLVSIKLYKAVGA
jgi:hypothetical protein